jgi:ankyrin repeat protein
VRNNKGETPLMRAYQEENIIALLNKGADINARDKAGYTPLIHAIVNRNPEKVKTLLNHGADINIKAQKGESALQVAIQLGDAKVIKMLTEAGAR